MQLGIIWYHGNGSHEEDGMSTYKIGKFIS